MGDPAQRSGGEGEFQSLSPTEPGVLNASFARPPQANEWSLLANVQCSACPPGMHATPNTLTRAHTQQFCGVDCAKNDSPGWFAHHHLPPQPLPRTSQTRWPCAPSQAEDAESTAACPAGHFASQPPEELPSGRTLLSRGKEQMVQWSD